MGQVHISNRDDNGAIPDGISGMFCPGSKMSPFSSPVTFAGKGSPVPVPAWVFLTRRGAYPRLIPVKEHHKTYKSDTIV
jgi:hypothetical protein